MKVNTYRSDQLVQQLDRLSADATPGTWNPNPKRLEIQTAHGIVDGPIMSYMVGSQASAQGMTVSLGSERIADHEFVAALVNAWREGRLTVIASV